MARRWECLEVRISMDSSLEVFKRHLLPLVPPDWRGKELGVKLFYTGHTNELMAIFLEEKGLEMSGEEVVLLRRNGEGSERLADRVDEIHFMLAINEVGLGRPVYAQLQNGLCYGFSPGHQVGLDEVKTEEIWKKIAEVLAKLHVTTIPQHFQNRRPQVWAKVDQWINEVPRRFEDPENQMRFEDGVGSIDALRREIVWLQNRTKSTESPIVFCHNDLVIANIVFDEQKGEVHLLDYEYGGPNFLAYDIADHFCAFAGAGREMNYEFYPTEDFQREWIRHYLKKRRQLMGGEKERTADSEVTDEDVEALYMDVNIFALASLLFWALWGLMQAHYSLIPFDYIFYANVKFEAYLRRKERLNS